MLSNRSIRDHTAGMDVRARLALFHGTSVTAEAALQLDDGEITYDAMMRSGVKATNLTTAGLGPTALRARGVNTAAQLRQLGMDSLLLCDPDFCNEACLAYGAGAIADAFLVSAVDAVNVAGTEAMHILNVSTSRLLECCIGFPGEAVAVLQQLPHGAALHGVSCETVLDAGLRADTLMRCGYGLPTVCAQLSPSGTQLAKLGYK